MLCGQPVGQRGFLCRERHRLGLLVTPDLVEAAGEHGLLVTQARKGGSDLGRHGGAAQQKQQQKREDEPERERRPLLPAREKRLHQPLSAGNAACR